MIGYVAFALFALTVPAANWLIGNVGTECFAAGPCVIPVGLGYYAPSGVLTVGAALLLRDVVHERLGAVWALAAILSGALLTAAIAPPSLAMASLLAFCLAEIADFLVYSPLRRKRLWMAVLLSGVAGAVIDSLVFLWLAFGSLAFVEGQVIGKVWISLLAVPVVRAVGARKSLGGER